MSRTIRGVVWAAAIATALCVLTARGQSVVKESFTPAIGEAIKAAPLVEATFYPEQEINAPGTGQPISIYRVDVKAIVQADRIYPIDVFRADPELVPMSKERAELELRVKNERTPLRIISKVIAASASAGAVVTGIRSFVRSQNPALDTRNEAKWSAVAAGTAFMAQYAPALASQIAGQAPVYTMPDDVLSQPFSLGPGEARTFHVVARGPLFDMPYTGVVR